MLLQELTNQYISEREISNSYKQHLLHRVSQFVGETGIYEAEHVTIAAINEWLDGLDKAPVTKNGYRRTLLTILHYAADRELIVRLDPRRIKRPKIDDKIPQCYTLKEIQAILRAAGTMSGSLPSGCSRSDYWIAIILAGYESGLRQGDLFRLKRGDVAETMLIVQHKTRKLVRTGLRATTVGKVIALPGDKPLAWSLHSKFFSRDYRWIAARAGVDGTFRWLRRTSGTFTGPDHLGHRSIGIFKRHYLDPRVRPCPEMPPSPNSGFSLLAVWRSVWRAWT